MLKAGEGEGRSRLTPTQGRSTKQNSVAPRQRPDSEPKRQRAGSRTAQPCNPDFPIEVVLRRLREAARNWNAPVVTLMAQQNRGPFRVLIGCLLSLRTKDETTAGAVERLFALGETPQELLRVPVRKVEQAIYPVGFYRTKARRIREICRILVERYGGQVPSDLGELLELPGVGRKTANLVVAKGFNLPGICVDTHVHRITNRWGYVRTNTPHETEFALRQCLPEKYWAEINDLLVAFGQTICKPISPFCSACPVAEFCARRGVRRHR
ncbi:MAG: endonuclease III [Candidatus Binatia bacterium]|nr:MAG: endonuclease III [Candidatus Binatia bacterium]